MIATPHITVYQGDALAALRAARARAGMTERELHDAVVKLAKLGGWRTYWTYRSTRSPAGFPDLVMVRGARLIFAELKTDKGRLTVEQMEWLALLAEVRHASAVGVRAGVPEVYTWRPGDLELIARSLVAR